MHLYFTHPRGELRNTVGRLPGVDEALPGLDLRGDGGYVVAAPSRHASGAVYGWQQAGTPVAPAPSWLRGESTRRGHRMQRRRSSSKPMRCGRRCPEDAMPGSTGPPSPSAPWCPAVCSMSRR
ncbi:MAG: bifunctional DNA primase/polymerase [Acidimicrobiia bacterium]